MKLYVVLDSGVGGNLRGYDLAIVVDVQVQVAQTGKPRNDGLVAHDLEGGGLRPHVALVVQHRPFLCRRDRQLSRDLVQLVLVNIHRPVDVGKGFLQRPLDVPDVVIAVGDLVRPLGLLFVKVADIFDNFCCHGAGASATVSVTLLSLLSELSVVL